MASIKSVLSKQLGNHSSKGPSDSNMSKLKTMTTTATFAPQGRANANGVASGPKQGTLGAAAKVGSNGYK